MQLQDTKAKDKPNQSHPHLSQASEGRRQYPEQAQKDKDYAENLALIAKYFKKLYKPTNNNLRTSSNTRNKNVDTTPRLKEQKAKTVKELHDHKEKMCCIDEQSWKQLQLHCQVQSLPNADSGTDSEPLEQVQYDTDDNVFANDIQHFDQSESISSTCAVETDDSNVTPDSPGYV
ncbi:hypothetical protein Tco_1285811 [Tanacetum coccineum]